MGEMKLILENWDTFVNEQFDACPEQPVDIDTFVNGLEIASLDPDVQKQRIEKLKSQGENVEKLNQILSVAGLLGGIPAAAASGGATLGATVVGVFANLINDVQQEKVTTKTANLLRLLCIDTALLATIDNDIEKNYWSNSGIQDEIEAYIKTARANTTPDPMPDFTAHLVDWLNTDSTSPYAQEGTPGIDTDIVVRK